MLHLRVGIEIDDGVDLLVGSSVNGVPEIRQVSQMPRFYRSEGRAGAPITKDWIEESLVLRDGAEAMDADKTQFRRVIRGLNTLFKGLKEETGQNRLHQFVRSLEAFEMRSNTEHLHVLSDKHEDVCWKRTRQIEHLACDAYSRLLRDPALRKRFQTEAEIEAFWKLSDGQRRGLYGTPLDIAQEPLVQE